MSEINEENVETTENAENTEVTESKANGTTEPTDMEAKARRMGWIDKERFNGPDHRFVDAEEFVHKGETELPILRERSRKQDDTIVAMGKAQDAMRADMKKIADNMAIEQKRNYEKGVAAATTRQRTAAEEGDMPAFDAATAEIAAATPPVETEVPAADAAQPVPTEITEFTNKHKGWYMSDLNMTAYADREFEEISKKYPGFPLQQQLDAVEASVRKEYPNQFGNPNRNNPGEVEGGGSPPPKTPKGKKFSDLPPEAQEMCDTLIRNKVIPDREAYIKEYQF